MDASIRLRIATRIHHALIRELGEGIDVAMMLGREPYAREVLHVCHACGNRELVRLARHFRAATEQEERSQREEAELHAVRMRSSSGFRVTQPPMSANKKQSEVRRGETKRVAASDAAVAPGMTVAAGAASASLQPRRWFGWLGLGLQ